MVLATMTTVSTLSIILWIVLVAVIATIATVAWRVFKPSGMPNLQSRAPSKSKSGLPSRPTRSQIPAAPPAPRPRRLQVNHHITNSRTRRADFDELDLDDDDEWDDMGISSEMHDIVRESDESNYKASPAMSEPSYDFSSSSSSSSSSSYDSSSSSSSYDSGSSSSDSGGCD